jgi:phage terminase large subunit-like protein
VAYYAMTHAGARIGVVAPTAAAARDVCVEGESGLLNVIPRSLIVDWNRSLGEMHLDNGAQFKLFSADEPDRLRGYQHHRAWCDEIAAWRYPDAWDQLLLGLRLGDDPRVVVTTTPRPTAIVRELLERPGVVITRGSTFENAANLAPAALAQLRARYEGTRMGRQELYAELLTDTPGALWTHTQLDDTRVSTHPDLARVVVAVDPSGGHGADNDEQGIVVCGKGIDGRGYVLADRSCKLSPDGWGRRAVQAYVDHAADRIVYEQNFGGEMCEAVLRTAAHAMGVTIATKAVHASRGKAVRAEPVAALYEQARCAHVGSFPELEDELCTWTPDSGQSPNRLDALVWACTDLLLIEESRWGAA